jgi:hypothetical protein
MSKNITFVLNGTGRVLYPATGFGVGDVISPGKNFHRARTGQGGGEREEHNSVWSSHQNNSYFRALCSVTANLSGG